VLDSSSYLSFSLVQMNDDMETMSLIYERLISMLQPGVDASIVWCLGMAVFKNEKLLERIRCKEIVDKLKALLWHNIQTRVDTTNRLLPDIDPTHDVLWLLGFLGNEDEGVTLMVENDVMSILPFLLKTNQGDVIYLLGTLTTSQQGRDQCKKFRNKSRCTQPLNCASLFARHGHQSA
jgi:hypothetical protein